MKNIPTKIKIEGFSLNSKFTINILSEKVHTGNPKITDLLNKVFVLLILYKKLFSLTL